MQLRIKNSACQVLVLLLTLSIVLCVSARSAKAAGIPVYVDGNRLEQSGIMQSGATLVPMRGIFEALKAEVKWDGATRSVKATKGSTEINLTLGHNVAYVNGEAKTLSSPAASVGGITMVPLRFIGEALGAEVKWDAAERAVKVFSKEDSSSAASDGKITEIVVSPLRALRHGETLTIEMRGEAAGKASFDIVGIKSGIPMHEEKAGRYVGEYSVPNSITADKAVIIGRLNLSGKESSLQAKQTFSTTSGNASTSSSSETELIASVTPSASKTIDNLRPNIGVNFVNSITEGSIKLFLDNQEVTSKLNFRGKRITYRPEEDLASGTHKVKTTGIDNEGQKINYSWEFTVSSSATDKNSSKEIFLNVTSPNDGDTVSSNLSIKGKSLPGATVTVSAVENYGTIINLITIKGRELKTSVTADSRGQFEATLNLSGVKSGSTLKVSCQATKGEQSTSDVNFTLHCR